MTTHRKPSPEPDSLLKEHRRPFLARVPLRMVLLCGGLLLLLLPRLQAAPAGTANEATVRAAVAEAVAISHPGAADQAALKILSRGDLDQDLSKISPKGGDVSFYEAQPPAADPG